MLFDVDVRRDYPIGNKKVRVFHQLQADFGDFRIRVSRNHNFCIALADDDSCGDFYRRVVYLKESKLQPYQLKRLIEFYIVVSGFQERNKLVYVVQIFGNPVDVHPVLNPVKLPET